ncbi:hypothetical protein JCGZ_05608 [Jatropha curcas]|uniref:Uncharacterized protein n=1 Tax=Jatropha curcas TaxID=180498 RepID=A0A067L6Q0_JATCU|nr:hypothetical protein JCGZ_05608 [Jatropha curcas]
MDSNPSMAQNNKKRTPPIRGQIKAQIFGSLTKSIVSVFSKAGEALKGKRGRDGDGNGGVSPSSCATPPVTTDNSDG